MRALWLNIATLLAFIAIIVSLLFGMLVGVSATKYQARQLGESFTLLNNVGAIAAGAVMMLAILAIYPSITYVQIQSVRGKKIGFGEAIQYGLRFLLRYIGLSIIVGLLTLGGFLLLIIPGFIVIRRYFLAPYFLIDQNLGILEAMRKSAECSKPYSWKIYDVIGVNILFSLMGIFPILGQFVGGILQLLYSFAPAVRYIQISNAYYGEAEAAPEISSAAPLPPAAIS